MGYERERAQRQQERGLRAALEISKILKGFDAAALAFRGWSDTKREALLALWNAGHGGQACGHALGVSRNAAIGQIARLRKKGRSVRLGDDNKVMSGRLSGWGNSANRRQGRTRVAKDNAGRRPAAQKAAANAAPQWLTLGPVVPMGKTLKARAVTATPPQPIANDVLPPLDGSRNVHDINDLQPSHCRWILGTTSPYCGAQTVPGTSWCLHHYLRVFPNAKAVRRVMPDLPPICPQDCPRDPPHDAASRPGPERAHEPSLAGDPVTRLETV